MNQEEIKDRLKEVEKEFDSEDFFDDLDKPVEVIESLISLLKAALSLLKEKK